ncbi:hypothetical protein A2U01_0090892, partial [Trifolium medium]|nr:hypothetical protein [Trifolium medium]
KFLQQRSSERATKGLAGSNETSVCDHGGVATSPEFIAPPHAQATSRRRLLRPGTETAVGRQL